MRTVAEISLEHVQCEANICHEFSVRDPNNTDRILYPVPCVVIPLVAAFHRVNGERMEILAALDAIKKDNAANLAARSHPSREGGRA